LNNTKLVPARTWRPFAVCDGISIPFDPTNTKTTVDGSLKLNAVSRHLRFVVTCTPTEPDQNPDSRTAFLQIASWQQDAHRQNFGYFRFYEVRSILFYSRGQCRLISAARSVPRTVIAGLEVGMGVRWKFTGGGTPEFFAIYNVPKLANLAYQFGR